MSASHRYEDDVVKSRFGYRTAIPPLSSAKGQTRAISFKDGVNTYKDNDDMKVTELAAAYDARFVKIGRYQTRRGLDHYSVPVGGAERVRLINCFSIRPDGQRLAGAVSKAHKHQDGAHHPR